MSKLKRDDLVLYTNGRRGTIYRINSYFFSKDKIEYYKILPLAHTTDELLGSYGYLHFKPKTVHISELIPLPELFRVIYDE